VEGDSDLGSHFHGKLLGLLANFATERPVRRQSRDGTAHLDTHEVWLLCREAQMLLDRGPSARLGAGSRIFGLPYTSELWHC
ncbi:MAG: hypothetical protein V3S27_08140, partial [Kiloniellales bacterium]